MRMLHRVRICLTSLVAVLACCVCLSARGGIAQPEITAVNADQTRTLLGTGRGVIIGVIDGGVDPTHPAVRGAVIAAQDFTSDKTLVDTGGAHHLGHGTGVAGVMVGHDAAGSYTGVAPGATLVSARASDVSGRTTNQRVGDSIFWAIGRGARVLNLSIGEDSKSPLTNKTNLMLDYVAEKYGAVVVAAAVAIDPLHPAVPVSAVQDAPGGQYNGLTIGSTGGRHFDVVNTDVGYSFPSDARTKPDLVAPGVGVALASANWANSSDYYQGTGTSFAAPIVGGIVAQLMSYGKAHSLSTDPLVLKAALMTSATHVSFPGGSGWVARGQVMDPVDGLTMTRPLDDSQGAGRVDALGAYQIYAHKTSSTVRSANWTRMTLTENKSYIMPLGNLQAGQRLDTALTWLHHVLQTGSGSPGAMTYTETAALADFSLTLLRDGKRVVMSDDKANNVEYLSLLLNKPGNYSLEVYRYAGSGITTEPFALAERVLTVAPTKHGRARPAAVRRSSAVASLESGSAMQSARPFAAATPDPTIAPADSSSAVSVSSLVAVPEPSGAVVILLASIFSQRRTRRRRISAR